MTRLKYMGASHKRIFLKTETWNGRLAEPLGVDVVFDINKGHIVESDGLSDAAVQMLLENEEIIDVSNFELAPTSKGEEMWMGQKHSEGLEKGAKAVTPPADEDPNPDGDLPPIAEDPKPEDGAKASAKPKS